MKLTKKECWDIIEEQLLKISESRTKCHVGEAKLAIGVIISAGRDQDLEFLDSKIFEFYCKLGALNITNTRQLLKRTIKHFQANTNINTSDKLDHDFGYA